MIQYRCGHDFFKSPYSIWTPIEEALCPHRLCRECTSALGPFDRRNEEALVSTHASRLYHAANIEYGLPPLKGSSETVAEAEFIRGQMLAFYRYASDCLPVTNFVYPKHADEIADALGRFHERFYTWRHGWQWRKQKQSMHFVGPGVKESKLTVNESVSYAVLFCSLCSMGRSLYFDAARALAPLTILCEHHYNTRRPPTKLSLYLHPDYILYLRAFDQRDKPNERWKLHYDD